MNISVSNIAWNKEDDEKVYKILQQYGIYGIDVAPARVFSEPFTISNEDGQSFINHLKQFGLTPVGMQSLLFGTQGLNIFGEKEIQMATVDYLKQIIDYAYKIGVKRLVFGSPKNRIVGNKSPEEIEDASSQLFNELGNYAAGKDIIFCIEPNPVQYGADFINNTMEGIKLVKKVNNKGFGLHVDLGTIIINNEDIEKIFEDGIVVIKHIHISHPNLEPILGLEEKHKVFSQCITNSGYKGAISIEMKNTDRPNNVEIIQQTIEFVLKRYQ